MIRILGSLAAAAAFSTIATAQTVSAPEGDWIWNAELDLNGLKLNNSGNMCLTEETSQIDFVTLLAGVGETCSVSDWTEEETAIHFSLSCHGDHAANMSGEISLGEHDASITLAGAVRLGDSGPITTVINGKAALTGACPLPETAIIEIEDEADTDEGETEPAELIEAALKEAGEVPDAAPVEPIETAALEDIKPEPAEEPAPETPADTEPDAPAASPAEAAAE